MSVEVTFRREGLTGLVAEGTYLSDAARRMGVLIGTQCGLPGECTSCVVQIISGETLLSEPSRNEWTVLGQQALSLNRRLACETRAAGSGELIIETMTNKQSSSDESHGDVRKQFADLPLNQKVSTLFQLEVATMMDAFAEISNRSASFGEKLLDFVGRRGKTTARQHRSSK